MSKEQNKLYRQLWYNKDYSKTMKGNTSIAFFMLCYYHQ